MESFPHKILLVVVINDRVEWKENDQLPSTCIDLGFEFEGLITEQKRDQIHSINRSPMDLATSNYLKEVTECEKKILQCVFFEIITDNGGIVIETKKFSQIINEFVRIIVSGTNPTKSEYPFIL